MRNLQVGILLVVLFQLSACGYRVVGWPVDDTTAPAVTSTTPADTATEVAPNAAITATFTEEMDPATISSDTFILTDGTTTISGAVSYVGLMAILYPTFGLAPDTLYTATIAAEVTDLAGNQMIADYVWTFRTSIMVDLTSPEVLSTIPADLAVDVDMNANLSALFSEPMDPTTISTTTFTLADGMTAVPGAVTYVGMVATFNPDARLNPDTEYTATITTGAEDLAGHGIEADYVWTFTTTATLDTVEPTIILTDPADLDIDVALNATIKATFSEAMDPLTVIAANFVVTDPALAEVDGILVYNELTMIATFTPDADLLPDTVYTVTVADDMTDMADNMLAAGLVPNPWTFTTADTIDETAPMVVSTTPADEDIDVALNVIVSVLFTEEMNLTTFTATTFTLMNGTTQVNGEFTQTGATVNFDSYSDLEPATVYTATITVGVEDLAGNALETEYIFNFTTADAVDAEAPTIILTEPADLDIDVELDATIKATFSEAMDPLTVIAANFVVTDPALAEVTGVLVYDELTMIATFTPQEELQPEFTYTVTVSTDMTDLAGNMLAPGLVPNPWVFTTVDAIPPFVSVDMGLAETFGIAATAGVTNTITMPNTLINGDVILDPDALCNDVATDNAGGFGLCNGMAPDINGIVVTNTYPDTTTSALIRADLNAAFIAITPIEGPPAAGELDGGTPIAAPTTLGDAAGSVLVLGDNWFTPGVYKSITSLLMTGDVTLDGQGDPNATFIFQCGSSLTTEDGAISPGAHTRILLTNGTKAMNVWWQVPSSATLGTYTEFEGNILAAVSITMKTGSTSCGRLMAGAWVGGGGAFVFDSNVVSVPGIDGCTP